MMNNAKPYGFTLKVLTCNIRVSGADDGDQNWIYRKELCLETIAAQAADIICFQEASPTQMLALEAFFTGYDHYALHDNVKGARPQNVICFRRNRFKLITASGYWLSETPHIPGSKSWESACIRFANWVRLADNYNDGQQLRIVNTHLDHVSSEARVNQARLLVEDAQAYPAELPQLLTGDLNCDETSEPLATLTQGGWCDSFSAVHGSKLSGGTFHAFKGEAYSGKLGKIDWILSRGPLLSTASEIIRDERDGLFPSDHYFVSATFLLTPVAAE